MKWMESTCRFLLLCYRFGISVILTEMDTWIKMSLLWWASQSLWLYEQVELKWISFWHIAKTISHHLLSSAGDAPGICSQREGTCAIHPPSILYPSIQTEKDSWRPPGIGSCSSLQSVPPEGEPATRAGACHQSTRQSLSIKLIQEIHPNTTPATANALTGDELSCLCWQTCTSWC